MSFNSEDHNLRIFWGGVLSTVRGLGRAGRVTTKSPTRDGKMCSVLVLQTSGRRALWCETNWRMGLWGTAGDVRVKSFGRLHNFTFQEKIGDMCKRY